MRNYSDIVKRVPRIAAFSYVTPKKHSGQEDIIAKFPLVVVPQQLTNGRDRKWKDRIREKNPDVMMLGYQVVCEEVEGDYGPGDRKIMHLGFESNDGYIRYPDLSIPKNGPRKLLDMRKEQWQEAFLNACRQVMSSYEYDGIFLDQCTVYVIHHPEQSVRDEMLAALRVFIRDVLRPEFPDKLLIANSRYRFDGINGELMEDRLDVNEIIPYTGHTQPEMNMMLMNNQRSVSETQDMLNKMLQIARPYLSTTFLAIQPSLQNVSFTDAHQRMLEWWSHSSWPIK